MVLPGGCRALGHYVELLCWTTRPAAECRGSGKAEEHWRLGTPTAAAPLAALREGSLSFWFLGFKHGALDWFGVFAGFRERRFLRRWRVACQCPKHGAGLLGSPSCRGETRGPSYDGDFVPEKCQRDENGQKFYWGGDPRPGAAGAAFQPGSRTGRGDNPLRLQEGHGLAVGWQGQGSGWAW